MKVSATLLAVSLLAAACGGRGSETDVRTAPPDPAPTEDSSIVDEPLFVDGEPTSGLEPSAGVPARPGITVGEALSSGVDGQLAATGFYMSRDGETGLCEALAESRPPLCGGATVAFDPAGVDLGTLVEAQGVVWSDHPVTVFGEIVDGRFIADPPAR